MAHRARAERPEIREVHPERMTEKRLDEYTHEYRKLCGNREVLTINGREITFEYWLSLQIAVEKVDISVALWRLRGLPLRERQGWAIGQLSAKGEDRHVQG